MSTENEQILQTQLAELQGTVEQITMYMHQMHEAIKANNCAGQQSSTTNFCGMQDVVAYLPFYISPDTCIVSVYEEIGCNKYRPVQPVIEYAGQQLTLNFDSPRSGFVTVTQLNTYDCTLAGVPIPPVYVNRGVALITTPEPISDEAKEWAGYEPPINPQPLTQKTPPGSEKISSEELANLMDDVEQRSKEKQFAKAMGVASTWP